jgi:TraX protein
MLLLHRLSHPASGALEVLKLAALVAMVADHANKYALDRAYPMMEHIGRLAFPLFALVIAANLRWNTADPQRYFMRLAVWGMASQAIYTWATGRTDLNILLTLGIGVQLVLAVEALRQHLSVVGVLWLMVVIVATLPCDYRLTGPLLVLLFHGWFARPGPYTALLAILGVAALNTSLLFAPAALASLIVAGAVAWWRPRLPRLTRYWFYPFYPTHFAVIRWIA